MCSLQMRSCLLLPDLLHWGSPVYLNGVRTSLASWLVRLEHAPTMSNHSWSFVIAQNKYQRSPAYNEVRNQGAVQLLLVSFWFLSVARHKWTLCIMKVFQLWCRLNGT